jgi:hypothetical protein
MYTASGKVEERSKNRLPNAPINRQHPLDGSFLHRNGDSKSVHQMDRAIRNGDRVIIIPNHGPAVVKVVGENIRKNRATVASGRSKMAVCSQPGHAQVFVKTQRQTDNALDNPVETFVAARHGRTRGMGGRSGGLARAVRV